MTIIKCPKYPHTTFNSQIKVNLYDTKKAKMEAFSRDRSKWIKEGAYNRIRGIILLAHDPRDTCPQTDSHIRSPSHVIMSSISKCLPNRPIFIFYLQQTNHIQYNNPNQCCTTLTAQGTSHDNLIAQHGTWERIIGPPSDSNSFSLFIIFTIFSVKPFIALWNNRIYKLSHYYYIYKLKVKVTIFLYIL